MDEKEKMIFAAARRSGKSLAVEEQVRHKMKSIDGKYLYNTESNEIGFAFGEQEAQERFYSKRSGWMEISQEEYYRIRDAIGAAIFRLKREIEDL